jgi:hypothetical protein
MLLITLCIICSYQTALLGWFADKIVESQCELVGITDYTSYESAAGTLKLE